MLQEIRSYCLANRSAQTTSTIETGYVVLPRPAQRARFFATITSASGTIKAVIQRGCIRAGTSTAGQICNGALEWTDYLAFTSTTTAGKREWPVIATSTASDSVVTTSGDINQLVNKGGPLGSYFRAVAVLSDASPVFSYEITAEFEF